MRPVSCHFCRSKKLRCNREFPCCNCKSRKLDCQLYTSKAVPTASENSRTNSRPRGNESEYDIVTRLRRLEEIVLKTGGQILPETAESDGTPPTEVPSHSRHRGTPTLNDADWLEKECMDQSSSDILCHPDTVILKTCPIQQITTFASYIYPSPVGPSCPGEAAKCVWLPQYEESKALVDKYFNDISYIHHIIHIPSVRTSLDHLYKNIHQQSSTRFEHVALFLSIFASATFSWTLRDFDKLGIDVDDINHQSRCWVTATLAILEYSRRTTSGSIEDIQAMIILSFVVCNLEGISSRYLDLVSTAITMARRLSLHRIDHPSNSHLPNILPPDSIQAEIGRRVWWHVMSTDWMLSRYPGPHEGVYTINYRHTVVNKPRNADDEDIVDGMTGESLPLSQPTSMSYFLQRIRLAELYRNFTDLNPVGLVGAQAITHSQVMELDAKIKRFIDELPQFFCLQSGNLDEITRHDARKATRIVHQRYIINIFIHAYRCKLHLQYLTQASTNPAFACSREICLDAARIVIKTERLLEKEDVPFALTRLKFGGSLYCVFMAIVVLLLDICFFKDVTNEELRKTEVVDACRILQKIQDQTSLAAKLLGLLMKVLRKHQVSLPELEATTASDELNITHSVDDMERQELAGSEQSLFAEFCQNFEENGAYNCTLDWSTLSLNLDPQI